MDDSRVGRILVLRLERGLIRPHERVEPANHSEKFNKKNIQCVPLLGVSRLVTQHQIQLIEFKCGRIYHNVMEKGKGHFLFRIIHNFQTIQLDKMLSNDLLQDLKQSQKEQNKEKRSPCHIQYHPKRNGWSFRNRCQKGLSIRY